MSSRPPNRLRAWLELIRPPNLPTVPGDPIAGFLLSQAQGPIAAWTTVLPVAISATLLYMAGLIWNDCADLTEDRKNRPQRPLPSERVKRPHAVIAACLLAGSALALAWFSCPAAGLIAVLLLALILSYIFVTRRWPWLGLVNMGACRAVSLLMGAAVVTPVPGAVVMVAAAGLLLMVTAISAIALRETEAIAIGIKRFMPACMLALTLGAIYWLIGFTTLSVLCTGMAVFWLGFHAVRLRGSPPPSRIGPAIGSMIKSLLLLQGALCALAGRPGATACAILLLFWPVSTLLTKWFHAS